MNWWEFDALPSKGPYDWSPAVRGMSEWDTIDFHLDLGCGTVPKGRLGIDRHYAPGVELGIDLETLTFVPAAGEFTTAAERSWKLYDRYGRAEGSGRFQPVLPFPDNSIESIVTHHCLEHIDQGFIRLMDEIYRVLKPGGILRAITPLFPSKAAVEDPDHKRYFMEETWETFCGAPDGSHWHESFSVPYTQCRFEMVHKDITARLEDPAEWWGPSDVREIRVALRKYGNEAKIVRTHEISEGRESDPRGPDHEAVRPAEVGGNAELAGVTA